MKPRSSDRPRVAAAAGADALEQSPLAGEGWARALTRGLLYAALLLFTGALLCRALLGQHWPVKRFAGYSPQNASVITRLGRGGRCFLL